MSTRSQGVGGFDPAPVQLAFPILADPGLHYVNNAATVRVPASVLKILPIPVP